MHILNDIGNKLENKPLGTMQAFIKETDCFCHLLWRLKKFNRT